MNSDSRTTLNQLLLKTLSSHFTLSATEWLTHQATLLANQPSDLQLSKAFSMAARKLTPAGLLTVKENYSQVIYPQNWDAIRLARVYLIAELDSRNQTRYVEMIHNLFRYAEMEELVALYSALPIMAYPEQYIALCADGLRSNIGYVQDALMINNPYPAAYLPELNWNQLVLKAFFNEKDMTQVIGLFERNNLELKAALSDYRQERLAAGRSIHPTIIKLIDAV